MLLSWIIAICLYFAALGCMLVGDVPGPTVSGLLLAGVATVLMLLGDIAKSLKALVRKSQNRAD